ncbi:HAD family hydrolase [Ectothiorhodospiraceae bacterium BW-2]|nr:HAD family hydrolase [Ectothiorhodospiraceae bacterium BW-2]
MLQALIFDVDGTLADTERDGHRVAFNLAFRAAALQWHWSEALYGELLNITGGKERISHYMETYLPDYTPPRERSEFIASLHRSKTSFYTELLGEGNIPLRPGVKRLLQQAREQKLRLAIATTTTPENVDALLLNTLGKDYMGWFEVVAAGDIVEAKKPSPAVYQFAMAEMGLRPEECFAFEDSWNGLQSALNAELPVLITTNGYTASDEFNGAALVVSDFGEPDAPFTLRQGQSFGHSWVDIELIQKLHQKMGYS